MRSVATADLVLSRFPRHLDADAPGKIIGDVVGALATAAETQIVQVGQVRRARRLAELDQLTDLARVIGLHGFGLAVFDALFRRVQGSDPPIRYDDWLDVARQVVADLIVLQREESGTISGLLGATAASLGLRVTDIDHDLDGYWHLAQCTDLLLADERTDDDVLLAIEENPPRLADLGPSPFAHSARFAVMRQGFDTVPATVIVKGVEDRSMRPMVVNIDEGFGVAATIAVPDGSVLRFERDGRVEVDGTSVVRSCFTFVGAVFADAATDHPKDFVFADVAVDATPDNPAGDTADVRLSVFAVTHPVDDAFDPAPSLPHGVPLLDAVRLDRRSTRFAAFVGVAAFATNDGVDASVIEAAPHPWAGRFDLGVFQPETPPSGAPAFEIGFEWDEREAYAVKVWLPREFQDLDEGGLEPLREVVRGGLDRFRAAGVHVYTEYADPRWTLGTGIVRELDTDDALGVVVAGTEAWEDDIDQPGDGPT